ncbi:MAG: hypothetical protein R3283_00700 [Balneolaceae bacterium]|nr:hypothetical protein [Balneolaceae bacterium]
MALLLFILSRLNSEVLVSGYLELGSFILFIVAVFSFFKLRDGKITIRIDQDEHGLNFTYLLKGSEAGQETLSCKEPVEFKIDRMPDTSLYSDINRSDHSIRFQAGSKDVWRYLFQYNNRVIPLTKEEAERVLNILEKACGDHR